MKERRRIYYSEKQKTLTWERWREGESLQRVAQLFDPPALVCAGIIGETGGVRPVQRHCSLLAVPFPEREEISRALVAGDSLPLKSVGH
ncbi:hypothetical protein QF001_000655 [Paraburkholderia youngii]|uniref:Uncharacterized protein n=1 Tax=Paraburkholderia youngii TaxID=2782701 RepID=A0A7Y6K8I1_9BURK|nr:hypothetical protein [Paraburkholderia youngii]NUY05834.1 hypothetical protein [Paraburkholderia youngii]